MKERSERFSWHESSRIHRPGQAVVDRDSGDEWIARQRQPDETTHPTGLTLIPANEPLVALLTAMQLARNGLPFCMADASIASSFVPEFTERTELRDWYAHRSTGSTRHHNSSKAPRIPDGERRVHRPSETDRANTSILDIQFRASPFPWRNP